MSYENVLVFKADTLIPVILEVRKNKCRLFLVKDQGVYIMPEVGQRDEKGRYVNISYAVGCNPDVDEHWYDLSVDIMGGDDGADELSSDDEVFDLVVKDKKDLNIKVNPTHYEIFI